MKRLLTVYSDFLGACEPGESAGALGVRLGEGIETPSSGAISSLATSLRKALARSTWIVRTEVCLLLVLFFTLVALVVMLRPDTYATLTAAGVNVTAVMTILRHLRNLWKDVAEIEIVIAMADNLPPADVLRFIELRVAQQEL